MSSSSSTSSYNSPCAACKFLRRKCMPGCTFAPYFPPEEPQKFVNVHKIFGASNVTKLLNEVLPHQREDAVNSLAYEAEARVRDPVYGCVGAISFLQRQVQRLQKELDAANSDLIRYANAAAGGGGILNIPSALPMNHNVMLPRQRQSEFMARVVGNNNNNETGLGGGFFQQPTNNSNSHPVNYPYLLPWNNNENVSGGGCGGHI